LLSLKSSIVLRLLYFAFFFIKLILFRHFGWEILAALIISKYTKNKSGKAMSKDICHNIKIKGRIYFDFAVANSSPQG
jgi:hypothetical protein